MDLKLTFGYDRPKPFPMQDLLLDREILLQIINGRVMQVDTLRYSKAPKQFLRVIQELDRTEVIIFTNWETPMLKAYVEMIFGFNPGTLSVPDIRKYGFFYLRKSKYASARCVIYVDDEPMYFGHYEFKKRRYNLYTNKNHKIDLTGVSTLGELDTKLRQYSNVVHEQFDRKQGSKLALYNALSEYDTTGRVIGFVESKNFRRQVWNLFHKQNKDAYTTHTDIVTHTAVVQN